MGALNRLWLATALLLFAACSSEQAAIPPLTPVNSLISTPTQIPDLGSRPEGVVRVAVVGAAPHNDVHQLVSEWGTLFGPALSYSRLLLFVPDDAQGMRVACDLCMTWRHVDELTLEFDVHPEALWQDGPNFASRPVTAQDVVFSLERLRTAGFPHAGLLSAVDSIQVVTDRTVRLLLRHPDADLPQRLASPYAVIMAPEAIGADVLTSQPVGSGPWRFAQGSSGEVNLDAWLGYHRPDEPAAQRIEIIPIERVEIGATLLKSNTVDIAQVGQAEWEDLSSAGFESAVVQRQGMGSIFAVNATKQPFDRLAVRRAVFLALNPWEALDEAFEGLGMVGTGVPVVERSWLLNPTVFRRSFHRPEAAEALLNSVELSNPAATLTIANFGAPHVLLGEILARQLTDAGFDVTTRVLTRSEYIRQVWKERDFELFVGPLPPAATTNDFLLGLVHSQGQQSVTGHADIGLDALSEAQSVESDRVVRGALVRQVQERLLDQALLFMPVITAERWAYGPRVAGFEPYMPAGAGDFWRDARVSTFP